MTTVSAPILPRRGGKHPILGTYLGGSPLNCDYTAVGGDFYYSSTTQLRSIKHLPVLEALLQKKKDDPSTRQFNGQLETIASSSVSELDKEEFIRAIEDIVDRYGFESFFYVPHPLQPTTMINLAEEPHTLSFEQVITDHNDRLVQPPKVFESDGITETPASISARFACYDDYEKCDFGLSRIAVESLVSASLRSKIHTRYSTLSGYKRFPGQVYFMMVLEVTNASVSLDISGARSSIESRTLSDYPGEDISAFLTDYRRDLKIMKTGYALPYDCGSTLLRKVRVTQHEIFNLTVTSLLEKASTMEDSHGETKDPLLLESHADYPTYGPFGLIDSVENLYGKYKKKRDWPAASDIIPQGNLAPTPPSSSIDSVDLPLVTVAPVPNANGRLCNPKWGPFA